MCVLLCPKQELSDRKKRKKARLGTVNEVHIFGRRLPARTFLWCAPKSLHHHSCYVESEKKSKEIINPA